jgi:hypothetical protein
MRGRRKNGKRDGKAQLDWTVGHCSAGANLDLPRLGWIYLDSPRFGCQVNGFEGREPSTLRSTATDGQFAAARFGGLGGGCIWVSRFFQP